MKKKYAFKVIGDRTKLPEETKELIEFIESETIENEGLKLTFAFDYGGRTEILNDSQDCGIKKACGRYYDR